MSVSTKARNERGRSTIRWIRRLLGRVCYHCGSTEDLTLDVIRPADHGEHGKVGLPGRASFYWRQLRRRNLQVLCRSCNGRKGAGPQVSVPFRPKHLCGGRAKP